MPMFTRRQFGFTGVGAAIVGFVNGSARASEKFEISKSDADWQRILSKEQFHVLRKQGTEPPRSSPLDKTYDPGTYHCAGCDLALFSSETKFDSGTGWPSFYEPLNNAVETSTDYHLIMARTEVHCRRCGGHLGHVFEDGPKPTGLRYCMNGVSLKFAPKSGNM
ncbi:MAG: peptide-methionine (R)-S-oxide reductase MsrB [Hyphomicrobiaceae bacterium]|nr:peptide-methionine (R)-S-oxide reductase MsrB [Hyphomicrobiaceae bacterium]